MLMAATSLAPMAFEQRIAGTSALLGHAIEVEMSQHQVYTALSRLQQDSEVGLSLVGQRELSKFWASPCSRRIGIALLNLALDLTSACLFDQQESTSTAARTQPLQGLPNTTDCTTVCTAACTKAAKHAFAESLSLTESSQQIEHWMCSVRPHLPFFGPIHSNANQ